MPTNPSENIFSSMFKPFGTVWNFFLTNPFNFFIVHPLLNVLVLCYKFLESLHIPGALGWAVIVFTTITRIIMYPLLKKQIEMGKNIQEIKPFLDELQKKYKDDKLKLQEETMKLYKEKGVNPADGCMPTLIQIALMLGVYNAINLLSLYSDPKHTQEIVKLLYDKSMVISHLDVSFFGFNLSKALPQNSFYAGILFIISAGLQYAQMTLSSKTMPQQAKVEKKENETETMSDAFKDALKESFGSSLQSRIMFSGFFGFLSVSFPLVIALYYNVGTIITIIQYKFHHHETKKDNNNKETLTKDNLLALEEDKDVNKNKQNKKKRKK